MKNNSMMEHKNKLSSKEHTFIDKIKVDISNINKSISKKEVLKYLDGNVEALNRLSVDRLKKLKEYYDNVIEENNKKIEKLKK